MTIKAALSALPRKIITASLAGTLFPIILGLIFPSNEGTHSYFVSLIGWTWVYLLYSFPVILIYGTITSTLSDYLAALISKKNAAGQMYLSALFHILFGLIFSWVSIAASIIFFYMDRFTRKIKKATWPLAIGSLCIPVLLIVIIWLTINLAAPN